MPSDPHVPLTARIRINHAAAQHVADTIGVAVLHIKGPAVDTDIATPGREGTDADVLIAPDDAESYLEALTGLGWDLRTHFRNSSAFEHSATLWHEHWGYLDVHRYFPGITLDPATAFARLWRSRESRDIAGIPCAVPEPAAQALIVILHAARTGGSPRGRDDVRTAWDEVSAERRHAITALVDELGSDVAFAAATGRLDDFGDAPDHDLWAIASRGGSRLAEWRARAKAAPTRREALGVLLRAPLVNVDHLAMSRGHQPTRREVAVEFLARPLRGLREVARRPQRRVPTGRRRPT